MALRSICCLSVADATTFSMLMKALPLSDNTGRPSSNRGRRVENSPAHSRKHDYRQRSPRWERSSLYRIFKIARSRREKSGPDRRIRCQGIPEARTFVESTEDSVFSGTLEGFFFPGVATSNANRARMSRSEEHTSEL